MIEDRGLKDIITWIKKINTTLYEGGNWISSSEGKAIPNIDEYNVLQAIIYSYVRPIILTRQNDTTFYGSVDVNSGSSGGFVTFGIVLAKTNGLWYISAYQMLNGANTTNGAVSTSYGISKLTGIIPKWGGVA
jgi:hypothetical protein